MSRAPFAAETLHHEQRSVCTISSGHDAPRPAVSMHHLPRRIQEIMSTIEITSKIEALKELESLIEEAKAEAETLRDEIKSEMLNRNTEEMEAGQYIVRWTSVLSQRFDTTAFKKVMPDVYKSFTKQVSSKRFSIA